MGYINTVQHVELSSIEDMVYSVLAVTYVVAGPHTDQEPK